MSTNESSNGCNFEAVCFSTNFQNFSAISIMKQYFMSTNCLDINYVDKNNVTFKHSLSLGKKNAQIDCDNTYIEVTPLSKNVKIKDETDCFIIFFDLEYNDSLDELNKILKMISDICEIDRKIYVITFYTDESNIKSEIDEENLKNFFGRYMLNSYDISKVNMSSQDELTNKIDIITKEALEEKSLINSDVKDFDNDKSKSACLIY